MQDTTFRCMGTDVRLLVDGPRGTLHRERAFIEGFGRRLSRFEPGSELCALNADPRDAVPASRLLRSAVAAGLWAAEHSGGMVDPTLTGAVERAGYCSSREGVASAPLREALDTAPPRRSAAPHRAAAWRSVSVDDAAGVIRRPPGLRLDTGGTGKGLCADAVAHRLGACERFVVDCGGDMALRGEWDVAVEHPLTREHAHTLRLDGGGVATSGLNVRVWRRADGTCAHHLIDPSTGEPAWTGLVGATAVAGSALEAETLSKLALLSGPEGARRVLAGGGGVLFHDDGAVEVVA